MGKNFVEPPLEALWWADDVKDLIAANKDKMKWRLMIVMTDWLTDEMFDEALNEAGEILGEAPKTLRVEKFNEGKSVQIMHIGSYQKISSTLKNMYQDYIPKNKLIANGFYHEIYLNDPSRVAQSRLKTVLRQPVC